MGNSGGVKKTVSNEAKVTQDKTDAQIEPFKPDLFRDMGIALEPIDLDELMEDVGGKI